VLKERVKDLNGAGTATMSGLTGVMRCSAAAHVQRRRQKKSLPYYVCQR
jgi:hypothetical protein